MQTTQRIHFFCSVSLYKFICTGRNLLELLFTNFLVYSLFEELQIAKEKDEAKTSSKSNR